ncbi:MAG: DHHA1 domain-containing protein [Nanoarchaeota archaeon]
MNESEIIKKIKEVLEKSKNPLYIIDDDTDGLCAYLLLKRYLKRGTCVVARVSPEIGVGYMQFVQRFNPDIIVILDTSRLLQEFIDATKLPIVWIDHHEKQKRTGEIYYYNPKVFGSEEYTPTTECCWNIVKQDMWIAGVGIISDWKIPPFMDKLVKEFPDLIKKTDDPGDIRFSMQFGKLDKIFNAIFKGETQNLHKDIALLESIQSPYELINEEDKYKNIIEKYHNVQNEYQILLKQALKETKKPGEFIIFKYKLTGEYAVTAMISEELHYKFPDKMVIAAREKDGNYIISLRATKGDILPALHKSLEGTTGTGGGHPHACGAFIPINQFDDFLNVLKKEWLTQIEQLG